MSTAFEIQTVCECQALLEAELNEERQVLSGWASYRGVREHAPANTLGGGDRFDVAWKCPWCGRNTLRTFHLGALRRLQPAA
jgi:hypothetical protein